MRILSAILLLSVACRVESTVIVDEDGDGWCADPAGAWDVRAFTCEADRGFGDCDDADPARSPGAEESCNEVDDDCDGEVDEGLLVDADDDGFFDAETCDGPGTDCDDDEPTVNPAADERCNEVDDDCDGAIDEDPSDGDAWWPDEDGDEWGDATVQPRLACDAPASGTWADQDGDGDDGDASVNPGVEERCNLLDDNCNGSVDEGFPTGDLYPDGDGDGWGADDDPIEGCVTAEGWTPQPGDCADDDAQRYPTRSERCNDLDDDCDVDVDEGLPTTAWWPDGDGDDHGDRDATSIDSCLDLSTSGYAADGLDCNDQDAGIHPGATEVCNGIDEDCDGNEDEGLPTTPFWTDSDGDGYGATGSRFDSCYAALPNTADEGGDCDDALADINPGEDETCGNLTDDDCRGGVDDGCPVIERFWASAWRGPSLLDLDRGGPQLTTCPTDTAADVWMSPRYGVGPLTAGPGPVEFVAGTKVVLSWQVTDAFSVALPALGLSDLPAQGTITLSPVAGLRATLVAAPDPTQDLDGLVQAEVAVQEIPYPHDLSNPSCVEVPSPDGLFPNSPSFPADAPPPTVGTAIRGTTERFGDNPVCTSFASASRVEGTDGWWMDGSDAVFSEADAPPLQADGHYDIGGYAFPVPDGADIWLSWSNLVEGDAALRTRVAFRPSHRQVCEPPARVGEAVSSLDRGLGTTTWTDHAWDFGRARESRPAFLPRTLSGGAEAWAVPSLQVISDGAGDAIVYVEALQMWCCGTGCGTCIDRDGDGFGPWCGSGSTWTPRDWDCDDSDPLRYPGNLLPGLGCGPASFAATCALP